MEINGDSRRVHRQHSAKQSPKASFAQMQESSGNVGKVSRKPIGSQGRFKEVERMYEEERMMQHHKATNGFEGAPNIQREGFISPNNTLPFEIK